MHHTPLAGYLRGLRLEYPAIITCVSYTSTFQQVSEMKALADFNGRSRTDHPLSAPLLVYET